MNTIAIPRQQIGNKIGKATPCVNVTKTILRSSEYL